MARPRTPKGRARRAHERLASEYPDAVCELDHGNAFELLVATILSAQATDVGVNKATPALFARYPDAETLAEAEPVVDAIERNPIAAMTLVRLLRHNARTDVPDRLFAESLTYSTLQHGAEFQAWLAGRQGRPRLPEPDAPLVLLSRAGNELRVTLNRPHKRNAYSAELRDALCEALQLAADDPDVRVVLSGAIALMALGIALMPLVHTLEQSYLVMLIVAPGFGGTAPLRPALLADYFGTTSFGTIAGLSRLWVTIGSFGGPLTVGLIVDSGGGYAPGWLIAAAVVAAGIPLVLAARPPSDLIAYYRRPAGTRPGRAP